MDNPFQTATYSRIWNKHFNSGEKGIRIAPFLQTTFKKKFKGLPLYINTGATHTKGISYSIEKSSGITMGHKVFLIFDIPSYFKIPEAEEFIEGYRLKKIKQYPGFLIELENYDDLQDFIKKHFSKNTRYKLKKYKRKLEAACDIDYVMYQGALNKDKHQTLFESFRELLIQRFNEKGVTNNNLDPGEWNFFNEVSFEMINQGRAGLFVVSDGNTPVAMTLNFFSEKIVFDAITVFNLDYAKFHPGSVSLLALVEWSLQNGYESLDFSKGYFDYKKKWGSLRYDFEYHIYYNPKSAISTTIAFIVSSFYKTKQKLREHGVNDILHSLKYKLRNLGRQRDQNRSKYQTEEVKQESDMELYEPIEHDVIPKSLRPAIFEFCFLNEEKHRNLKVYKDRKCENTYILANSKSKVQIKLG